jgi:F0F1-type ATP synthase membrane subunit c/vacuolar-type H+-ATPase subunit K
MEKGIIALAAALAVGIPTFATAMTMVILGFVVAIMLILQFA